MTPDKMGRSDGPYSLGRVTKSQALVLIKRGTHIYIEIHMHRHTHTSFFPTPHLFSNSTNIDIEVPLADSSQGF